MIRAQHKIDFQPAGSRIDVSPETTLLAAAQLVGVDIKAICGGIGVCGGCRVRLVTGTLSEPGIDEAAELGPDSLAAGYRLACQTRPTSNVRLEIPPDSLTASQRLQLEAEQTGVELDPMVRAYDIALEPPTLADVRSDATRVYEALSHAEPFAEQFAEPSAEPFPVSLASTERLIVLASVAALFALFIALQLTAYFGDPAALAGTGITYAEWARRGFGELATATALVTLLIVALDAFAARGDAATEQRVRLTAVLLVALTMLITFSALRRVVLYEAAYGYTAARIRAQLAMLGVGSALALLGLELWGPLDARRFARRTALAVAALITVYVYWNHDAFIVRRNVEHFAGTDKLDVRYLGVFLSPDAFPALLEARASLPAPQATRLSACLAWRLANDASRDLRPGRWFEFNSRRNEAIAAIAAAQPLAGPAGCGYTRD